MTKKQVSVIVDYRTLAMSLMMASEQLEKVTNLPKVTWVDYLTHAAKKLVRMIMIRLSNLKLEIDIPALTRIADALEGIDQQLNAIGITQDAVETQQLDISTELEELNRNCSKLSQPNQTESNIPD